MLHGFDQSYATFGAFLIPFNDSATGLWFRSPNNLCDVLSIRKSQNILNFGNMNPLAENMICKHKSKVNNKNKWQILALCY